MGEAETLSRASLAAHITMCANYHIFTATISLFNCYYAFGWIDGLSDGRTDRYRCSACVSECSCFVSPICSALDIHTHRLNGTFHYHYIHICALARTCEATKAAATEWEKRRKRREKNKIIKCKLCVSNGAIETVCANEMEKNSKSECT